MKKFTTDRKLILVNFAIVFYFILIWLTNIYKVDYALIRVFREILTIPFLIAQIIFLVIGINYLRKNQKNYYLAISVLALAICSFVTIGSFF
ncbi:hypothetical protein SAMN04487907_103328 [Zunongwangia mangrovi]|uniref:Uncharacterized protein n=1 Tax=Zunongwangia mangrovi TaxID=1334022 RepID=A0A1I1IET5_9FLAO|nr:hypothetical protein [Zunongwangia mangrovi]SFC32213.1 hypothetical protein SAMN04487907_103328 [Zunongwangia mangrovi]